MTVVEAECNTPIAGDRYGPIAGEVSLERMQAEPRNAHIIRPAAAVQYRKNVAKFFNMRRRHSSCRSSIIKGFEPAMFKRLNHVNLLYFVVRRLSIDNCGPSVFVGQNGLIA